MRDAKTRKADTLAALEKQKDVWLATADPAGRPHLIAASAWWDGAELVVATRAGTKTARNMEMNPVVRIARGAPSDAIVIEAQMIESRLAKDASDLATGFAAACGWNPLEEGEREGEGWAFFRLRPTRIQAFRGYEEVHGRDVMIRSEWLA
jgi:hypothetical protein